MRRLTKVQWMIILISLGILAGLIYTFPPVQQRLSWRMDFAMAYLRGIVHPVGRLPTPMPTYMDDPTSEPSQTLSPTISATPTAIVSLPTTTPVPSPTPIPAAMELPAPAWEKQDINNCGPASLTMYLRYYGWKGDQYEIDKLLKPQRDDRNVNVDELAYFVRTQVGWLNVMFRVGGDQAILKQLLAAGIPVIIEESFYFDKPFWPNDDLWAAHYNLITGYDDTAQTFTTQDSFYGSNQKVPYARLADYWHVFNHVYLLVYTPDQEPVVKSILGKNWDEATNRQIALDKSLAETKSKPNDAFAWFNTGNNLVYFERYDEAAAAFDKARDLGLPQRMLRYQFSPFFAYFHTGRIQDLLDLTNYALKITPNAEEAMLWHGWALYRKGDTQGALADFQNALVQNPNYLDAQYALKFVQQNP